MTEEFFYQAEDVREAARNRWPQVLSKLGVDAGLLTPQHSQCPAKGRCPGNDGKSSNGGSKRFRFDDQGGEGTWICSGAYSGDGIALLAHVLGCEWKEAVRLIGAVVCPEKGKACGSGLPSRPTSSPGPAPAPVAPEPPKKLEFDVEALRRLHRPDLAADEGWFAERSPVDPRSCSTSGFLEALFRPGEKVLIFTNERSQGQFVHWVGHGSYVLGGAPGVRAKASVLPRGAEEGVWYLCQPVDGLWYPNPRAPRLPSGELRMSRRSMESVTAWRYLVLESDEAPDDLWRNLLAQLPLPIAAIYTSGRRSIHALVKLKVESKPEWDAVKRQIAPLFTKLGADAGALSAVRLTRLPGCFRGGKLQRLLYLNPEPELGLPICAMPALSLTRGD